MELRETLAVVTGGASGIGLALARGLLAEGARVVLADVEEGALATAVADLAAGGGAGAGVWGVPTDVSDPASVEALARAVTSRHGDVGVVFANAGVTASGAAWESTLDDWRWMLDVNVMGTVHCVRSFVPRMIATGAPGHVCITGSLAGYLNQPGFAAYNATKHAVIAIAETLAADLREAGHPIGVTVVAPWFVTTRLAQSGRNRPASLGDTTEPSTYMQAVWRKLATYRDIAQPPEEVATQTLDAVKAGRFSVFPFAPAIDAVRARFETVLAGDVLGLYQP
jgi:NAD(P)-dependent dehydrogenase (short-subunit alcohol dehydrogenase family)